MLVKRIVRNYDLYLLLLPTLAYFIIFHYIPMYGVQIAFKNFNPIKGIMGSPWVGLDNFERFFQSYQLGTIIRNTLGISVYELLVAFPAPIILALMINQLTNERFKRFVQTVTYAPHFISTVVVAGIVYLLLSPKTGAVNSLLGMFHIEPIFFMGSPEWFKTVFVFSGIWQNIGWGTIIYLAALTAVNPEYHEAAVVDGASKLQRVFHIDIPAILPTVIIMLIMNMGHMMSVGFEKVYLMQNQLNIDSSETIQTYVYKAGLVQAQYSYSSAIGLFNTVINFILLLSVNQIAKSLKQSSLW
ncbi:ABC transporter permease subunit [Paenibacillus qinlingensis]|uniref:Aldouronate transport system permease protein n=1 Tax=Paenibacillus qinlingensis TaxID=1837343 RepID=A0ABU1NTH9_9BACL|nr:ABC transporter permease subunit [Paenibacillus qinlingensis]MDR6550768.1 putative aldouronate transport system permease protein [Paenibacillus qinlingensis]